MFRRAATPLTEPFVLEIKYMALPYRCSCTSCARLTDVISCFIMVSYRIALFAISGHAAYTPPTCEVPKGQKDRVRNSGRNLGAEGGQETRPFGVSQHRRDGPGGPSPTLEAKERSKVPDVCATFFYLLSPGLFPLDLPLLSHSWDFSLHILKPTSWHERI